MLKLANADNSPPGVVARWRALSARRRQRRLVSARTRRSLAASARRAATSAPVRSRHTVLLVDRAAAVRDELLELALILEHADHRDASWVFAIRKLLTDGCESPLYNRDVHMSELRAALYYLRREPQSREHPQPVIPVAPPSPR
jgi:hypothetical protein